MIKVVPKTALIFFKLSTLLFLHFSRAIIYLTYNYDISYKKLPTLLIIFYTGSLPTFIDAGTNFNSYEILEDNFLSQALSQGKNISFMGCSTWTELFPSHFHRKIPFSGITTGLF